ncbi:MAG: hypothetical protein NTV23_09400 [Propionibacteriales bacterium]|nr:hypothetical protein [Propionibacteriales bacterium]
MKQSLTQRLVDGLEEIGRSLYLQVFTAPNGIALLDWVPQEHRALTVWVHDAGADLRLGRSVHAVLPIVDAAGVDALLAVLRQALVEGSWYETYVVDEASGEATALSWRVGSGAGALRSGPGSARPAADSPRVRRPGVRWGPTEAPPDQDLADPWGGPMLDRFGNAAAGPDEAPIV